MVPAVWPGDEVTVRQIDMADLEPGQIVVFRQDEKLVIHRVECVRGDHLITRGDSRPRFDLPVQASEMVGRVLSISRSGRTVDPRQTFWQRIVSSILRRSEFCTRVTVHINLRLRRLRDMRTHQTIPSTLPAGK
jgi:hypothetical protein